jgi:hypothetical protein
MAQMAKKKQFKKHKLKHGEPSAQPTPSEGKEAPKAKPKAPAIPSGVTKAVTGSGNVTTRDFSYVAGDLRRILILAVSLVGVEIVLWVLFGHTGLGNAVYQSIKP